MARYRLFFGNQPTGAPAAYTLPAVAGSYALTGTPANLSKSGAITIFVGLTAGVTDGVIGSGGSLPTGWGYSKTSNITLTVVSHGGDDGVECFDLKIDATTAATSTFSMFWPNGFGGMPSSPGKRWKTGAYLKQMAVSGAGINGNALSVHEVNSGGGYILGHDNYAAIPSAGNFQASYREVVATLFDPAVAKTDGGLYISQNAVSAPSSVTIRIAAKLEESRLATADAGAYALAGQATSLEIGKEVLALAGAYALSGQAVSLEYGREVLAVAGSYALTGTAATFRRAWKTAAVAGAYALSGQPATFARTWKTTAVAGSYTLAGIPVNLLKPGAWAIIGLPGAYALTGSTASLERGREVLAVAGSYALSGTATSLEKGREVLAVAGSYALTGTPATLSKIGAGTVLIAEAGSYALTGKPVTLVWSGEVVVTPPGGGGMPWYGRPSGIPSKQLRKAVKELLRRQEKRRKPKKAKELAKELIASIKPQGLGVAEKRVLAGLLAEGLQEVWPIYFASETIHDKADIARAILFVLDQAMQRLADEEEDEEAALLLLSAA